MTKAETFERAWRLGYKGDYSLVDEIYYPEYSAFEDTTGITANLEDDKTVVLSLTVQLLLVLISVFLRVKIYCVSRLTACSERQKYFVPLLQKLPIERVESLLKRPFQKN